MPVTPLDVWCPTCGAERGRRCIDSLAIHLDRLVAARTEAIANRAGKSTQAPRYSGKWRTP